LAPDGERVIVVGQAYGERALFRAMRRSADEDLIVYPGLDAARSPNFYAIKFAASRRGLG
jgi:hypothetical protein